MARIGRKSWEFSLASGAYSDQSRWLTHQSAVLAFHDPYRSLAADVRKSARQVFRRVPWKQQLMFCVLCGCCLIFELSCDDVDVENSDSVDSRSHENVSEAHGNCDRSRGLTIFRSEPLAKFHGTKG